MVATFFYTMTQLDAIEVRHSVRKYLDKKIPADIIAALQDKIDERIGYYGEQLVLLAQTLGLNTCREGLSYCKYNVADDENLACMIPLGYGETQGVKHKIKTVEQVSRSNVGALGASKNASGLTPSWFKKGVEAALLAPTAVNQQKFSFEYLGNKNGCHLVKANGGAQWLATPTWT